MPIQNHTPAPTASNQPFSEELQGLKGQMISGCAGDKHLQTVNNSLTTTQRSIDRFYEMQYRFDVGTDVHPFTISC